MIYPEGGMGETGSSYPVALLMRSCTVKSHDNLSPGIWGHLVLLPKEPETGTRLVPALPRCQCSLFCLLWKLVGFDPLRGDL